MLAAAGFDVEIVEKHHNQKLDAPSGTALALADSINEAMDNQYEYIYDRSQVRQKRSKILLTPPLKSRNETKKNSEFPQSVAEQS